MTTTAPSAAPSYAIRVWSDGIDLFAEIPGSPPYVMRLALTEAGLHKALNLLRARHADAKAGRYKSADRLIHGPKGPRPTESQREAALEVLRKLGMV